jgi:dTDP-4-dehydrorhamnose reductase
MKVLLYGSTGQVGFEISKQWDYSIGQLKIGKADLLNETYLKTEIKLENPDLIINAAAYTDVESCENFKVYEQALKINALAPRIMAEAKHKNAILFHYSTDYVFADSKDTPYMAFDETIKDPLNAYGKTKLLGEKLLKHDVQNCYIFRTSWVYSSRRKNFLKTLLRLIKEKAGSKITVISDQKGSPTSANEISRQTILIAKKDPDFLRKNQGTYHLTSKGYTSWFGFAREIMEKAKRMDFPVNCLDIVPISSKNYPVRAKRPLNSKLDCFSLEKTFEIERTNWQTDLENIMNDLKQEV